MLIFLIPLTDLCASGFYIPDVGAKCLGRGGAFVARADDITAIYHNPAGLVKSRGTTILLDVGLMDKFATFDRMDAQGIEYPPVKMAEVISPVPFLGFSSDFRNENFVLTLAAYGPYGVPLVRFPEEGPQRYNIVQSSMQQIYYSLGAGIRLTEGLSVGLTLSLIDFFASQKMKLDTGFNDADLFYKLSGRLARAWTVGGLWKIQRGLEVGAS